MLHSVPNAIESLWRTKSREEGSTQGSVRIDPAVYPSENIMRELRSLGASLRDESRDTTPAPAPDACLIELADTPLFDLLPDGTCILDDCGLIVRSNKAFLELLDLGQKSPVGIPFQEFASKDELVHMIGIGSFFDCNTFSGIPMKLYSGRGELRTVSVSGSRMIDPNTGVLVGFILTIHDTREFHRQLNGHSRSLAQEKDRSHRLENAKLAAEERSQFLTESVLKRYVAPSVINEILDGDVSFDKPAELENVTVLFCDLAGFTRASERLGTMTVSNIINEFFTVMSDVIFEHGGTIDKFIGDSIMAVFGAPKAMSASEQAERALSCALAMQEAMEGLKLIWAADGADDLELRVGMHQGDAVVGNFGSYRRVDYTCIGSNVNLASRIESVCEPGEIFVSEVIAELVGEQACEPAGEFELKGIDAMQSLYRVCR
ncbi:MAG: adenylate/guanylate cyclase domain-containing protein [Myxococcota bacterium]|nr:adenylate/guanylate cyclase domain-containing protein [Myxococcota bacterium]